MNNTEQKSHNDTPRNLWEAAIAAEKTEIGSRERARLFRLFPEIYSVSAQGAAGVLDVALHMARIESGLSEYPAQNLQFCGLLADIKAKLSEMDALLEGARNAEFGRSEVVVDASPGYLPDEYFEESE